MIEERGTFRNSVEENVCDASFTQYVVDQEEIHGSNHVAQRTDIICDGKQRRNNMRWLKLAINRPTDHLRQVSIENCVIYKCVKSIKAMHIQATIKLDAIH
jgi:hypothetical protein